VALNKKLPIKQIKSNKRTPPGRNVFLFSRTHRFACTDKYKKFLNPKQGKRKITNGGRGEPCRPIRHEKICKYQKNFEGSIYKYIYFIHGGAVTLML